MIVESVEPWCEGCRPMCELFYANALSSAYILQIDGSKHGNLTDWSISGKWMQRLEGIGPIDTPERSRPFN
jgi:hypothetical protein